MAIAFQPSAFQNNAFQVNGVTPPAPDGPDDFIIVRDPWDRDEWGRFIPGAGYRKVPR